MPVEFKQDSIREWLLDTQEKSTISDVVLNGCQGGTISELIYYADSCAFYEKYEGEIWDRLDQMSCDMGEASILHLIASFNGSKEVGSHDQFRNLLAWWAVEVVCSEICMDWDDEERATA